MLDNNDEELEKRKERARQLRNSVGMVTNNDIEKDTNTIKNNIKQNLSISNISLTDDSLNTLSDNILKISKEYQNTDSEYQQKLLRAKELRNSMGMITNKDKENQKDNYKKSKEELDKQINEIFTQSISSNKFNENSYQSKEQQGIEDNTNQINSNNILLMSKDNKTVQPDKNKSVSENILNMQKNNINLSSEQIKALGNMSREDRAKQINTITRDRKQQGQINIEAENVAQNNIIEKEANKINEDLSNNNFWSSIWHVIKTIPTNAIDNLMNIGVTIDNIFSNSNDTSRIQSAKIITSRNDQINANINNKVVRTAGNVGLVLGDMAPSIISELMMPGSGRFVASLGSGSSSYVETLNEEENNKGKALLTGLLKGGTTYATEGIAGGNILGRGSLDDIAKRFISNKISNKIARRIMSKTYEVGGEILEEQVENHVGYVIDKMLNNKDITLEEYINEFNETNQITFLTTVILSLFGMGGNTYKEILNEERINEIDTKTQESIKEAEKIIKENNLSLIDNKNIEDENLKTYTILNIDNNSNVLGLTQTVGKEIDMNNKELNIKPAIVRNHEYFEIIDGESGIKLDTSGYLTENEAIQGFNEKIKKADKGTIYNINDMAVKGKLAMINTVTQMEHEINNYNNSINNQYNQVNDTNVQEVPEINTTIDDNYNPREKIAKIEKTNVRNLRTVIEQIQDNTYYNSQKANEIIKTMSDNFDNVTYTPKGKGSIFAIKNNKGQTIYSKEIRNNIGYSGKNIKNILSNVYNNVMKNDDTTNNSNQRPSEPNVSDFYTNETNYAVKDIKKVTEPFNRQEYYSKDEMTDIWNNEVFNHTYDAYYDKDGNIERYIAIEEEGKNIVVNQYDNDDNIVRSAIIPSDNGRYNNEDIKDTILKVSSNIDLSHYIQEMATNFKEDLNNTLPGERYKSGDTWTGQKRATTKELANIKDDTGASWNKIGEVLNDIANGKRNNTKLARTIEYELDKALSEGYTNIYRQTIFPNEEYLEQKSKVYGRDFNSQISDDYDPTEYMTEEDFRVFGMKKVNKKAKSSIPESITEELHNKIQHAISSKNSREKTNLGIITTKAANKIEKITGIEVNNRKHILLDNDIRHMLNQHSDKIKEAKKGQIAITSKDIEKIPDIINDYDRIIKGTENTKGEQSIRYTKKYDNKRNYVVEIVPKDNNNLIIKTMWIKPIRVINSQQTPNLTSKTKPKNGNTTSSNHSISQNTKSVKNNTATKQSMQNDDTDANTNQRASEPNTSDFYTNETNYAVKDIKKVTEPFNKQKNYSKEKLAEIWNNEVFNHTYDAYFDKDGNIERYIAIEEDGDNIVVNQYDNNDNIVKSEVIPVENGRYSSKVIKDIIDKVASLQDKSIQTEKNNIKNNKTHNKTFENEIKKYKKISKEKNIINGKILEININIFEGISKKKQSNFLNEFLKYEVRGQDYFVDGQKIIANNTTIGKLKNGRTNFNKKIDKDIRQELKANIIGNLENVIKISRIYQKNRPDTKDHSFADTFDRRKSLITYKNETYEIMFEIGKKENLNTLYSIENIKKIGRVTSGISHNETSKTPNKGGKSTQPKNSITQNTKSVKNDKNVTTKQSMQNDENNTQEQQKIQKELHNRIANALLSKNTKKNTYLGEVTEKVAKKVKSLLDIDITGRKHMISDYNIRHIINQHGNPEIEKTKGQIAVTKKDIEKIPDILSNYDSIEKGSVNTNSITSSYNESIRYIKKYNNNIIYVVEVVPKTGKTLEIKTMWKKPITLTNSKNTPSSTSKTRGNNVKSTLKKEPVGLSYGNNTLPYTSETKSDIGSITSIAQNTPNVKDDGVRDMKPTKKYNNYTQKELDNLNSPKIRIANSEKDVLNFIETAKKIPNNLKLYFGKIDTYIANKIQETLGINVTNYNISLKTDAIRHIMNNHTNSNRENSRGQIPITSVDILNIPDIINNYDTIKKSGTTEQNKDTITFEKNIDGNTVVVTYVSDKHNNLEIQTMYKFKNNKKRNVSPASNVPSTLNPTSETVSSIVPSKDSIPQNGKNVKDDGIRNMKFNNSNQLKNSNNANSTSNKNIRFAKRTAKPKEEVIEPGATNAQRDTNYIEQEIRKIEESGKWDESIPVTKMTDIRKTIENYLGLGIQKGHFRQQAYGIYKGNRDVIRTKELKDIDTILHETGHALDIGKRIKIDKESIANELLKAVNNYGGYETESREIRLEEGFAEVIRMYTIVPEQAKIEYPQTVSVLEGIRNENADFDNFIRKVQEQTYNYIHQRPRNRGGLSNMSIGEQTDKMPLTPESIRQRVIENAWDSNYSIKRAVEVLQEKGNSQELKASENAYLLTRLTSGIGDKITSMLSNGYIDENGNKLFPGLNQLGELLNNDIERFNDLRAYLVAQRDLEYKAKKLKTGIRTMDSKAIVEEFKNDTQIQEASKIIYDTLDGVLQYAVNNKLITPNNAKALRESNTFYVPMQRVLGTNGNNVGRKGAVADIIRARTGSELDIKDVLENIVTNSANIIQQVENNLVIKALYNQGESVGLTGSIYDEIDPPMKKIGTTNLETWKSELKSQGVDIDKIDFDKTIDIFVPNNNIDEKNQIVSFIDNRGQRRYLQFHDEILFNALIGLDRESTNIVLNILNKLNKPLKFGAVLGNLSFALPNMLSDTVQASIYSEAGFIPLIDTAIGTLDVLASKNKTVRNFMNKVAPQYADRVNMMYHLYEQSGATSATKIGQERKSAQMLMKDIYGTNNSEALGIKENFKPIKRLLDIMTYIPELSEQSTRFRVFEKNLEYYRRNGMEEIDSRIQAALQSRDATQDFSRTGKSMREVNKLVLFSAARVGSSYTFLEKIQENPKRTSMRIAILMAISMGIKALTSDDDEINELNQRKKDDNFVFKIGDQIITIKKPQGILRSMINLSDYIIDLASGNIEEGKEGERLVEWLCNAIMDNSIADDVTGLVPSAITPLAENALNKDFYYKTDIVKSYDLELPDSEQYYDYNSQLAIWLGKIFNYSPAKIDNFISGYFAGLGTQVTNIIDWMLSKTGVIPEKPNMGLESNSIGKRFFINANTNSTSVDELYDLKTELTKKKNGNTITDEEAQQLENINNALSNMTKLNKQIKEIKKDLTMSSKEKAEKIKILQKQKTDMARSALGKELLYPENETNNESITFYPSQDTLSQNGYVLNLTSDMKKEYEQLAYNKYKQYENHGLYSKEKLEKLKEKSKDYAKSQLIKKYKNDLIKK